MSWRLFLYTHSLFLLTKEKWRTEVTPKFFFSSFVHVCVWGGVLCSWRLCTCVCVHIHMCEHMYVCICACPRVVLFITEADLSCLPRCTPHSLLRRDISLVPQVSDPAHSGNALSLPLETWGYRRATMPVHLVQGCWVSALHLSCLHRKHFIWVSPQPCLLYFILTIHFIFTS